MPTVTAVHKVDSADGSHKHISEVCVGTIHYTRAEVVAGLDSNQSWKTQGTDGSQATIRKVTYCPHGSCILSPYITTAPDHTTKNNLDNLPAC